MIKKTIYIVLALLSFGVIGCEDDNSIRELDLSLSEPNLTMVQDKSVTFDIYGNGRYEIKIDNPLSSLGTYEVLIVLHKKVSFKIKVILRK